jgi:hypothetical protein
MDPLTGKIVLNGAPSQLDRWLRALDAAWAQVDGRSLSELLDFAVQFGHLVQFYDLCDQPDGDWVELFLADPAMILAAITAADLAAREAAFSALVRATAAEPAYDRKFALLRETFAAVLALARQIDAWLRALALSPRSDAVRQALQEMEAAVQGGLGEALRRLKSFDQGAGLPAALAQPVGLDYSGFLPVWELGFVCPDGSIYRGATGNLKIDHALPRLTPLFDTLLDGIRDFQSLARAGFAATLAEGWHKPQIALYIAFVNLFHTAQDSINTLSSRYLRFYYDRILREPRRPAMPDSVYLTFTLAGDEGLTSAAVPRGTLFPAGQDAGGNDILYAADRDLNVTAARIAQLRTLRVLSGPLLPAAPDFEIVDQRILTAEAQPDGEEPWPTFGGTAPAELGFALASNYLLLSGGERSVWIIVRYTEATKEALQLLLDELAAAGFDPTQALREVLAGAFRLDLSTAAGWFRLAGYEAIVPEPWDLEPWFAFALELPASVPPIAPFAPEDPTLAGTNPAPALPTLEAWLRQEPVTLVNAHGGEAQVYPLSLLGGIAVTAFEIQTRVEGLPGLALANTDGEADPSAPFPVFGAVPVAGSYLQIRHAELFAKVPESLEIALQWFGLPPNDDGFKGWYRDYVIGLSGKPEPGLFDNASFHGGWSVLNPGAWTLQDAALPCSQEPPAQGVDVHLFRTQNDCGAAIPAPDGKLCGETAFGNLEVCDRTTPPYYDPAASAVRLELTAPGYAFGNDLYTVNVLNAVIEDLPDVPACEDQCAAECQPFKGAARCIETSLENCKDTPEDQYAACIQPCIAKCQQALLLAFVDRFLSCLETCALDGETLDYFRGCIQTCLSLPGAKRALSMKTCVEELRARLDGERFRCIEGCLAKCLKLLEALLWIESSAAACNGSPTYKDCMTAGLTACVARLDALYDDCFAACMAACTRPKKELKYPNEPWLPQAQSLTLAYSARCSLSAGEASAGRFFQLLPFGGYQEAAPFPAAGAFLLPQFPDPGTLYLGFSGLSRAQKLNLLFQMTASRGESGLPAVAWSCLSSTAWQRLTPAEILLDTTDGLKNSGVAAFSLPAFDPAGSTLFPGGFQWLRATVTGDPDHFPATAGIAPHVLTATWRNDGGTGENLRQPLPAHTITSSVQNLAGIATIGQPMESFGGKPPEDQRGLDVRLGERLRHKDRALLAWDYERLVLERFPSVWKTQALPARNAAGGNAPGDVLVVIVPGAESQQVQDPTLPLAPGDLLRQIQTYLEARTSPFVCLPVVNPQYVRIQVTAIVTFRNADDPGTDLAKLNADLVRYLSPWYYDAARAAKEGRYANEDEISEFVQTRPYVAALESIAFSYSPEREELEWYFLTSAAEHVIYDASYSPSTPVRGRCLTERISS